MSGGIAVAGNLIMDVIKRVPSYPKRQELTEILRREYALGGLVCNVARDLARLDGNLRVVAVGLVGEDSEGELIRAELSSYPNIDISHVGCAGQTSFTDVLTEEDGRVRTFLTFGGANAEFDVEHVPLEALDCGMLHVGYALLLPKLDAPDEIYGTRLARLLAEAKKLGISTSIDVVSDARERYASLVPPALLYTDYCIINEIEAGKTTGIALRREDGSLDVELVPVVLERLFEMGVSEWAVIHAPEGGFGMDRAGNLFAEPSLALPDGFIEGTVGAGDAFCAGVLYAAFLGEPLSRALALGAAVAAMSLGCAGASEGVGTAEAAWAMYAAHKVG